MAQNVDFSSVFSSLSTTVDRLLERLELS